MAEQNHIFAKHSNTTCINAHMGWMAYAYWAMYGLRLSDEVLKKVYYKNALRIVPGMDKTLFPDSGFFL
jgi:hypothetical protein